MGGLCCDMTCREDLNYNSDLDDRISDFLAQVRPLDLLVFRGADGISPIILSLEKIKTGCGDVSHVEIVINYEWCDKIIGGRNDVLFSWGSTLSGDLNDGVSNAETGTSTFGVQLRVLKDLVRSYLANTDANVGLCRLINNPTVQRIDESDEMYAARVNELKLKIGSAYDKYNGKTYNASPIALLAALFPSFRYLRTDSYQCQQLFCSEFVALVYEEIGVITDETDGRADGRLLDPRDVLPVDFIGRDADINGIVNPICEVPPMWIKPTATN